MSLPLPGRLPLPPRLAPGPMAAAALAGFVEGRWRGSVELWPSQVWTWGPPASPAFNTQCPGVNITMHPPPYPHSARLQSTSPYGTDRQRCEVHPPRRRDRGPRARGMHPPAGASGAQVWSTALRRTLQPEEVRRVKGSMWWGSTSSRMTCLVHAWQNPSVQLHVPMSGVQSTNLPCPHPPHSNPYTPGGRDAAMSGSSIEEHTRRSEV